MRCAVYDAPGKNQKHRYAQQHTDFQKRSGCIEQHGPHGAGQGWLVEVTLGTESVSASGGIAMATAVQAPLLEAKFQHSIVCLVLIGEIGGKLGKHGVKVILRKFGSLDCYPLIHRHGSNLGKQRFLLQDIFEEIFVLCFGNKAFAAHWVFWFLGSFPLGGHLGRLQTVKFCPQTLELGGKLSLSIGFGGWRTR